MGEWHEVSRVIYKRDSSPCDRCGSGSADVSEKWENGKLYQKFDYCHETCQLLNEWRKAEEIGK